jgi:chemosensory pili system protein ChpA (sensor histidine kinase/response regulator)
MGNVLLIVDLPELVRQWDTLARLSSAKSIVKERKQSYHPDRRQRTVLIADDSLSIRQSVSQILSHAGYSVLEAHDGMEALEKLLEEPVDVVLLDIEMPNLNGYDLLNILQGRSEFAQLKIVMLTSRSSQKHLQRAFDLGASAYLIKPCPQDTLLEMLQNVLRAR